MASGSRVRRNKVWLYVSAAWLLLAVLGQLSATLPPSVLVGSLVVLGVLVFGWPRAKGVVPAAAPAPARRGLVRGSVEPPTERHAYKAPTTVRALVRSLSEAEVGQLEASASGFRLALPDGQWARLEAAAPDAVTQATVSLEGSSFEALAITCDALARELGPMRLRSDGAELVVDGTRPAGQLRNDAAAAVELRDRRARHHLRELEARKDRAGPDYLN